jgi:ABC-2 type transport system ATP-binding protein
MAMIQVKDLTKFYGPIQAVDHVSFSVDKGEVIGFLGPNGAGKSTTMRILTTFIPATSGTAKVAGFDVMTESLQVRQNLGYLPENVPLYPEMRVEEYLHYRAKLKGVERKQRALRVGYCMDRCRLLNVRRRLIGTLSRGFRQRVGLAEAMVHDPPILIMDEPTAGLDPIQIQETQALIKELGEKHTILLSTHILPEVEEICERVIVISQGQVKLDDRLAHLRRDSIIALEVRGPAERVQEILRGTDGVVQVTVLKSDKPDAGDGVTGFEVRTVDDRDLRLALADRIAKQGWTLRRLDLRRRSLREHFMKVTMGREM